MGKGAGKTIVQAVSTPPASDRVFDILPGYKVVMYDLTVRYGYVEGGGGGIRVDRSALKLRNVTVDSNVAFLKMKIVRGRH